MIAQISSCVPISEDEDKVSTDGTRDCTGRPNSAKSKAFRLCFWFYVYMAYKIAGKHCIALHLHLLAPGIQIPSCSFFTERSAALGKVLSHWFSVRFLMLIPLWWESPQLVSQVAQRVMCDQVFFFHAQALKSFPGLVQV